MIINHKYIVKHFLMYRVISYIYIYGEIFNGYFLFVPMDEFPLVLLFLLLDQYLMVLINFRIDKENIMVIY